MDPSTLAFGMPGTTELIIIAVIALLIFGRRLPDVARSVGKSIIEFKRGIRDAKDDLKSADASSAPSQAQLGSPDAAPLTPSQPTNSQSSQSPEASRQETSASDSISTN